MQSFPCVGPLVSATVGMKEIVGIGVYPLYVGADVDGTEVGGSVGDGVGFGTGICVGSYVKESSFKVPFTNSSQW